MNVDPIFFAGAIATTIGIGIFIIVVAKTTWVKIYSAALFAAILGGMLASAF